MHCMLLVFICCRSEIVSSSSPINAITSLHCIAYMLLPRRRRIAIPCRLLLFDRIKRWQHCIDVKCTCIAISNTRKCTAFMLADEKILLDSHFDLLCLTHSHFQFLTFGHCGAHAVRVTWPGLKFYTTWNIFGTAKATDFKFCARLGQQVLTSRWPTVP